MTRKPRILFVGMSDSVHTARYLSVLAGMAADLHLFPAYFCRPHPGLRNVTLWHLVSGRRSPGMDRSARVVGLWPFRTAEFISVLFWRLLAKLGFDDAARLNLLIRILRPDIVHTLEFQQAGYLMLEARSRVKKRPTPLWIATNWGSDIYAFGRLPEHAGRIRQILAQADVYACECYRDVLLAREFGFAGEVMPVVPNSGGFGLKHCATLRSPLPPSQRRVIAVKGYQYSLGRSLVALRALERVAHLLKDYRIVVYSPFPKDVVDVPARLMAQRTGLSVELMDHVPHDEILKLHGAARLSISLSISDAICTSMTEAMVMGSFPIQSDTACADEWVEDGRSALLVNADDSDGVAAAIARALSDDQLVDEGTRINLGTAQERLDADRIGLELLESYRIVLAKAGAKQEATA
jgi:glycosyltransferase involved in cell wall biosynthesis